MVDEECDEEAAAARPLRALTRKVVVFMIAADEEYRSMYELGKIATPTIGRSLYMKHLRTLPVYTIITLTPD